MASIIRTSRDQVTADGVRPIPRHTKRRLAPFFPAGFLDDVRWTTSGAQLRLDTLLAGSLDYPGAVTFDNVIVFFDEEGASDLALWLHELEHVRQYQEADIEGFARQYVTNWRAIEKQTHNKARRMLAEVQIRHHRLQMAMRARRVTAASPPEAPSSTPRPPQAT